jgi:hypothetical protein
MSIIAELPPSDFLPRQIAGLLTELCILEDQELATTPNDEIVVLYGRSIQTMSAQPFDYVRSTRLGIQPALLSGGWTVGCTYPPQGMRSASA